MKTSRLLTLIASCLIAAPGAAEVVRDGTIGPDAGTQPIGPDFLIPQSFGERSGNNLFHSFSEFSIGVDQSVTFTGEATIANVIARVTGGMPSLIDGALRSEISSANLFLLNPQGIMFGAGASLDIDGALKLSTAERLVFDDGLALPAAGSPVLSVAAPADFGLLGGGVGDISFDNATLHNPGGFSMQARRIVSTDSSLLLFPEPGEVAGSVELYASEAIELHGVTQETVIPRISRSRPILTIDSRSDSTERSGDFILRAPVINLTGAARLAIAVHGEGDGGDIDVLANTLSFSGNAPGFVNDITGSMLFTLSVSDEADAGDIRVNAGHVTMDEDALIGSWAVRAGDSGDVTLFVQTLHMQDNSEISTRSQARSTGRSGDVFVQASESIYVGGGSDDPDALDPFGSLIVTKTTSGESGDITLIAPSITIDNGGRVDSATTGDGSGGDVTITAAEELIIRGRADLFGSLLGVISIGGGDAGTLRVTAPRILLEDGGSIQSDAIADGTGGAIEISADQLIIRGDSGEWNEAAFDQWLNEGRSAGDERAAQVVVLGGSLIRSTISADAAAEGTAGSININAREVLIADGGQIVSLTAGSATGGEIRIQSESLTMIGNGRGGDLDTRISSDASNFSDLGLAPVSGDAGSVSIETGRLTVRDGAGISSSSEGVGNAGNIGVAATSEIRLDRGTIATEAASGAGGNITLGASERVLMFDASVSTSVATGDGDGGAITIGGGAQPGIRAPGVIVLDKSVIQSTAQAGEGGKIQLIADNTMLTPDSVVDVSAQSGRDGEIEIISPDLTMEPAREGLAPAWLTSSDELSTCRQRPGPSGSFTVTRNRGVAASPDDLLMAFGLAELPGEHWQLANQAYLAGDLGGAMATVFDAGAGDTTLTPRAQILLRSGDVAGAEALVNRAIKLQRDPETLSTKGAVLYARRAYADALAMYLDSARLARDANDPRALAVALANGGRAALGVEDHPQAAQLLNDAATAIGDIADAQQRAAALVHTARSYGVLAENSHAHRREALLAAFEHLARADQLAADDPALRTWVFGNLSRLYTIEARYREALHYTQLALRESDAAQSPAEYRWAYQAARLQWALGDSAAAIRWHRRAVALLEAHRIETRSRNRAMRGHFQEALAPVYLGLVRALLDEHARSTGDDDGLVLEARAVMDRLATAELRDYFDDECLTAERLSSGDRLTGADDGLAVIYPILLGDELVLIAEAGGELAVHRTAIATDTLLGRAAGFREAIQQPGNEGYLTDAAWLFDALVAPTEPLLQAHDVNTLLFIPPASLRALPLAALHDGERYLVERYRITGMSAVALATRGQPGSPGGQPRVLLAGTSEFAAQPSLPHVPLELAQIAATYRGARTLLNDQFTARGFEAALLGDSPDIVHIATHGVFAGNARESYLAAGDARLFLHDLEQELTALRFQRRAVDLLVLSACQTAVGDDEAALGLAGLGVRAGASNAVGSLWNIADASTSVLFGEFYRTLSEQPQDKAGALAEAQLSLLRSERYSHPFFWSGMVLIQNWL